MGQARETDGKKASVARNKVPMTRKGDPSSANSKTATPGGLLPNDLGCSVALLLAALFLGKDALFYILFQVRGTVGFSPG